jgi:hypothetical protein
MTAPGIRSGRCHSVHPGDTVLVHGSDPVSAGVPMVLHIYRAGVMVDWYRHRGDHGPDVSGWLSPCPPGTIWAGPQ